MFLNLSSLAFLQNLVTRKFLESYGPLLIGKGIRPMIRHRSSKCDFISSTFWSHNIHKYYFYMNLKYHVALIVLEMEPARLTLGCTSGNTGPGGFSVISVMWLLFKTRRLLLLSTAAEVTWYSWNEWIKINKKNYCYLQKGHVSEYLLARACGSTPPKFFNLRLEIEISSKSLLYTQVWSS